MSTWWGRKIVRTSSSPATCRKTYPGSTIDSGLHCGPPLRERVMGQERQLGSLCSAAEVLWAH